MADKKIVVLSSLLFCAMVGVLLLVLYYPESSDFDDEFETWTEEINLKLENEDIEPSEPTSKIAITAKILENMGAGFLALLAVICIAVGLAFLTCACCVLR